MPTEISILHEGKLLKVIDLEKEPGVPVPMQGEELYVEGKLLVVSRREFHFTGPIKRVVLRCDRVPPEPGWKVFCAPLRDAKLENE